MIIYGTALLAACHLLGIFLGDLLGQALGVKTNVGGVGIAMLLLIFARIYMAKKDILPKLTELGVEYWGAMYIPVVVAMAAQQDVVAALRGGPVALLSARGRGSPLRLRHRVHQSHRTPRRRSRAGARAAQRIADRSGVITMIEILQKAAAQNGLVTAFAIVGVVMLLSMQLSKRLTMGRVHGSAIAIVIGLALAYWGGIQTGGHKGLADLSLFGGIGLMGGAMLRDFAIVATAFEVQATEARKAGMIGAVALLLGTVLPFIVGASVAWSMGLLGCGEHDDDRRRCGHVHRRPCHRRGDRRELGCDGAEHRDRPGQGDHRDGRHADRGEVPRAEDASLGDGLRRAGRHRQRRLAGLAATDRKLVPYGAPGRHVSHRTGLPARGRRCSSSPPRQSSAEPPIPPASRRSP